MGLRSSTTTEPSLAPMHSVGENGDTVWRLAHMCREGMEEKGGGESLPEGRQKRKTGDGRREGRVGCERKRGGGKRKRQQHTTD